MDGYALRGIETAGAGEYNPLTFSVLGQALPGQPFVGAIRPNEAIRIMTGAPVPEGVDAVVPAEYATETAGEIVITRPVAPGQHVGHCGEDIREGSPALGCWSAPASAGCRSHRFIGVGAGIRRQATSGSDSRHGQ